MKTLSLLRTLILVTTLCLSSFSYAESVVVVVSATSPVSKLDKEQVANLFLGKSSGYPDGSAAVPIEQTDATPAHEEFHKSITEKSASQLKSYWSKMIFSGKGTAPKEVSSNAELLKLISSNPAMIGYVDKTAADKTVKVVFAP
ncbi:MAG: phosphate ABC transporter substrate-binding protein [Methylococcaceae bacterium]|nr:MAG: phosphate ABC transporter substrate-binding protein [Methylococcaceae bacterium]